MVATQYACPNGTFSNRTQLAAQAECDQCTPGWYCSGTALTSPTGECAPSHYCSGGATVATPLYASHGGGLCDAGHVCTGRAATPRPTGLYGTGYVCPAGTTCGVGASHEVGCAPGTYNPTSGQSSCLPCPIGRVCPGNNTTPDECPLYHYCPANSITPTPCPLGTIGTELNLQTADQCDKCPAGKYCRDGTVAGDCYAGFACYHSNDVPNPDGNTDGGEPCPIGHYCPAGVLVPKPCSNGTVRAEVGGQKQEDCTSCPPGFTCVDGNPVPFPCDPGQYCPGNSVEVLCGPTTHNPDQQATNVTWCLPCPAGFFCKDSGIWRVADYPCPVGHYCTYATASPVECPAGTYRNVTGAWAAEACTQCPAGYTCGKGSVDPVQCPSKVYCAAGSFESRPCPAGYYCPPASGAPIDCPAGSYCPAESAGFIPCPDGHYCPPRTVNPLVCPQGWSSGSGDSTNTSRNSLQEACTPCAPGTYAAGTDGTLCNECTVGYVCLGQTKSATPASKEEHNGYPCPPGYYCPAGSSEERACPAGTYNPLPRMGNSSACRPCAAGYYGSLPGQSACRPCSSSATSEVGSTACTCTGQFRAFQSSDGFCVCLPGYEFYDAELNVATGDGDVDCQPVVKALCDTGTHRDANGNCVSVDCNSVCESGSGTFNVDLNMCQCDSQELDAYCDSACRAAAPQVSVDPLTGNFIVTDPATGNTTTYTAADFAGFVGSVPCVTVADSVAASDGNSNDSAGVASDAVACNLHTISVGADGMSGVYGLPTTITNAESGVTNRRRLALARYLASATSAASVTVRASGNDTSATGDEESVAVPRATAWAASGSEVLPHVRPVNDLHIAGSGVDVPAHLASDNAYAAHEAAHGVAPEAHAHRRRRLASGAVVPAPIVCIVQGEGLLFDLTGGPSYYPEYVKDSLLNTNDAFDYGEFRRLASLAKASASVTVFGFTFTQAGTYVFATNSQSGLQTIVKVLPAGSSCPTSGAIEPASTANLVALGIKPSRTVTLEPNWLLLAAVLLSLLGVVTIVVSTLYYFRRRGFKNSTRRGVAAAVIMAQTNAAGSNGPSGGLLDKCFGNRGGGSGGGAGGAAGALTGPGGAAGGDGVLSAEELDLKELLEYMQEHYDRLFQRFDGQAGELSALREELSKEMAALQRLMAESALRQGAVVASAHGGNHAREAALLLQIEAELAARGLAERQATKREEDITLALSELRATLQPNTVVRANVIMEELKRADEEQSSSSSDDEDDGRGDEGRIQARMNSQSSADILRKADILRRGVDRYVAAIKEERARRRQGVPLWKAAAGSGLLSLNPSLAASLESMETQCEPLDAATDELCELLGGYAEGASAFREALLRAERSFLLALADAHDQKNPAVIDRICRNGALAIDVLLTELAKALGVVTAKLPGLTRRVTKERDTLERHRRESLEPIKRARQRAEEKAKQARERGAGGRIAGMMNKMQAMLGGDGTYVDVNDDEWSDSGSDDGGADAEMKLFKQVDKEARQEQEEIQKRVEDARRQAEEEERARAMAAAARAEEELADSDLTDEQRARLLEEYNRDRAKLGDALDMERKRQQAELHKRLQQRREEKLAQRLRAAELRAEHELKQQQEAKAKELEEQQKREMAALQAELDAEAAREQEALDAETKAPSDPADDPLAAVSEDDPSAVDGFDVESELNKLRRDHDREVSDLDAKLEAEQRRQRARLAERLRLRRRKRNEELTAKQQAELAEAKRQGGSDTELGELAVSHAEERKLLEEHLATEERIALDQADGELAATAAEVEAMRRAAHEAYDKEVFALAERTAAEARRQKASVADKLAERAARRKAKLRQQQQVELARARGDASAQARLQREHREQAEDLEEELNKEARSVEKEVEAKTKLASAALRAEEEARRIREQYDTDAAGLRQGLDVERRRQREALQQRLAARRQQKEAQMRAEQAKQLAQATTAAAQKALEAKHAQEEMAMIAELTQEGEEEEAEVENRLASAEDAMRRQLLRNNEDLQAQLRAIRERHTADAAQQLSRKSAERRRQKAKLEARLEARRAKKEAELRRRQAEERVQCDLDNEKAAAEIQVDLEAEGAAGAEFEAAINAALTEQVQKLVGASSAMLSGAPGDESKEAAEQAAKEAEDARRDAELAAKQEAERAALAAKQEEERRRIEAEAAEEAARVAAEVARAKAEEEAARKKREAAMANMTEEEAERARKEYEEESHSLEARREAERRRQQEKLAARLEAKKARQQRNLRRRQEKEMATKMAQQQRELAEREAEKEREREKEALKAIISADKVDAGRSGEAIEVVLNQRHARETSEMIGRHYNERAAALHDALEDVLERKKEDKANAMDALRDEDATQGEIDRKLAEIDHKYEEEQERVSKEVLAALEASHAQEQIELRHRQLAEVAEAYAELAPDEVLKRHEAEEAQREALELKQFQDRMQREKQERIDRIKNEKAAFEEELRRQNDDELAKLELEHQALVEREKQQAERRLAAQRQQLMAQQEEMRRNMMEEAQSQTQEVAEAIMAEWDQNQEHLLAAHKKEKMRQAANLREKLQRRAVRLREQKQRELEQQLLKSKEEAEQQMADVEAAVKRRVTAAGAVTSSNAGKAAAQRLTVMRVMSSRRMSQAAMDRMRSRGSIGDISASQRILAARQSAQDLREFAETGSLSPRSGRHSPRSGRHGRRHPLQQSARPSMASFAGSIPEDGEATFAAYLARGYRRPDEEERPRGPPPVASAVNARLNAIENLLERIASAQGKAPASADAPASSAGLVPRAPSTPPPPGLVTFQDDKEAQLTRGSKLEAVPQSSLSFREAKRHEFGCRLLEALGLSGVALVPASSLPGADEGTQGPFSNSFQYDAASKSLYVRTQRLAGGGELMDVLVHAAAYIKTAPERPYDASAPGFAEELHRAFRTCGQELFSLVQAGGKGGDGSSAGAGHGAGAGAGHRSPAGRGRAPGLDLSSLADDPDPLLEVPMTSRVDESGDTAAGSSGWAAGSLSDRVAQVGALRGRRDLQEYLHRLEEEAMVPVEASDDEEDAGNDTAGGVAAAYAAGLAHHVRLLRNQVSAAQAEERSEQAVASAPSSDTAAREAARGRARAARRRADALAQTLQDKEQELQRFRSLPADSKARVAQDELRRAKK